MSHVSCDEFQSFFVHSLITDSQVEGKGFVSSIWDWLTAPFASWYAEEEEDIQKPEEIIPAVIVVPSTIEPAKEKEKEPEATNESRANEAVQEQKVAKSNCNEHTCTTTYCLPDGTCVEKSCNIYDTNMKGECQEYAHLQMSGTTVVSVEPTTEKEGEDAEKSRESD